MEGITLFSQRDPRWADKPLGTGTLTIGQAGCLLSCAAGVLATVGVGTDPGRLNDWLTRNGGYVDDNLFLFQSIEAFGVDLIDLRFCPYTPAPVGELRAAIERGQHVVLEVDAQPGGAIQPHWVRLLAPTTLGDPWQLPGHEETGLAAYLAPGWDLARAILAYAVYAPATRAMLEHRGFAGEAQRGVRVR